MRLLTYGFEMVRRGDIIRNSRRSAMVVLVGVSGGDSPDSRREAERTATLAREVRNAMGMGLSISRVIRPDCACDDPLKGASDCCAACGGENVSANVRLCSRPRPAAPVVNPTAPVDDAASGNPRDLVRQQVTEALATLGMSHVTIDIQWNGRFGRGRRGRISGRLGDARVTSYQGATGRVRFASRAWPTLSADLRREVVLHEVAHVVADLRNGRRVGHSGAWKSVMRELGLTPRRCVSLS